MESSVCPTAGTDLSFTEVPDAPALPAVTGTVDREGKKLIKANTKREPTNQHTGI